MSEYIPRPGDMVTFPGAPVESNRIRGYVITEVNVTTLMGVTGGRVEFRADGLEHVYSKGLHELREIGMTLLMSADKLDPTMEEK